MTPTAACIPVLYDGFIQIILLLLLTCPLHPSLHPAVTHRYGKRLRKCTAVSEWPLRVGLGSHWCISEAVLKLPPRWLWSLTAILMAWSCSSWWALTVGLINTGFHPQSERDARKPITGPEHELRTPEVNHCVAGMPVCSFHCWIL